MPEIDELPELTVATDEDALPIVDVSASAPRAKHITRGNLLRDVPRNNANASFAAVSVETLAVTTSITVGSATMTHMCRGLGTAAAASITAGATQSATLTLSGCEISDYLSWAATSAITPGIIMSAYISAPNTVTVIRYNCTGATISDSAYTIRMVALRFT